MPVLVLWIVPVVEPFLKLAEPADLQRCEAVAGGGEALAEFGVAVGRHSLLYIQNLRRLDAVIEQVADDFHVHRRPGADLNAKGMLVLRRERRAVDEPVVLRLLDERVEEELGGAAHDRVGRLEEFAVATEFVMVPEVLAEPGATAGPHAGVWAVARRRRPPDIGVVMADPAAGAIVNLGRAASRLDQLADQLEQRLVTLGEVCHVSRPIVHLRVDIDRVLAPPRRLHLVVPQPLQRGGLSAGRELLISR